VLIVSLHYAPEPNFISQDVALALSRDADVTVITAFPNYPLGRFYDGRRHLLPRRMKDGEVTLWRVPMIPDRSKSIFRRLLVYGSISLSAILVAPFVARRASVVWVYNTPPTLGLAALWFKAVYRSKVIFTYADLWPESFVATGVGRRGWLFDVVFAFRKWINTKADMIIGSTRGTIGRFAQDGVPAERLTYIPVWVQGVREASSSALDDPPRIVYAGNMGPGQNLEPVIAAASELHRRKSPVRFDLYGYGTEEERLKTLAQSLGAGNVMFHGRVTPEAAFEASARALAQVVTLRPDPMFDMTLPSKLPFCFAVGAPVFYSLRGEAATVAERSGASFPFHDDDPAGFADSVEHLLSLSSEQRNEMRTTLREYYRTEFGSELLLSRYRAIILGALPSVGSSPIAEQVEST
jgi:glycosyltransferase involved in cell wall biosynthesis